MEKVHARCTECGGEARSDGKPAVIRHAPWCSEIRGTQRIPAPDGATAYVTGTDLTMAGWVFDTLETDHLDESDYRPVERDHQGEYVEFSGPASMADVASAFSEIYALATEQNETGNDIELLRANFDSLLEYVASLHDLIMQVLPFLKDCNGGRT
jgi:hypothetical protein